MLLKFATILGSWHEDLTLLLLRKTFCLGHVEVYVEKSDYREDSIHEEDSDRLHWTGEELRCDEVLQENDDIFSNHGSTQGYICTNLSCIKWSQRAQSELEEERDHADENEQCNG